MTVLIASNTVSASVTSGGTTAVAAGTSQAWTVTASNWPTLSAGQAIPIMDYADIGKTSGYEIMWATTIANGTGVSWTVTRGAELTGGAANPYAHQADFTVVPVLTQAFIDGSLGNMTTSVYDPAAVAQQVVGTTATQTIQNKRLQRRVLVVPGPGATPAMNTDNYDEFRFTALALPITSMTTNLTGTPNDGDSLIVCLTDNGTSRSIVWGTSFESSTVSLPTATVGNTLLIVGFLWNQVAAKWRCVASV